MKMAWMEFSARIENPWEMKHHLCTVIQLVKVKVTLGQDMKTQSVSRCITLLFL